MQPSFFDEVEFLPEQERYDITSVIPHFGDAEFEAWFEAEGERLGVAINAIMETEVDYNDSFVRETLRDYAKYGAVLKAHCDYFQRVNREQNVQINSLRVDAIWLKLVYFYRFNAIKFGQTCLKFLRQVS